MELHDQTEEQRPQTDWTTKLVADVPALQHREPAEDQESALLSQQISDLIAAAKRQETQKGLLQNLGAVNAVLSLINLAVRHLPVVERIITAALGSTAQRKVHVAAVQCLPFLQQRAQHEAAQQTLLRAVGLTALGAAQLLRPADSAAEVKAAELLRAGPSQEAEP